MRHHEPMSRSLPRVLVDILMRRSTEVTRINVVMGLTMIGTFLVASNILLGIRTVIVSDGNLLSMLK